VPISRRSFLKAAGAASAGLTLGIMLPSPGSQPDRGEWPKTPGSFRPNIWLQVTTDGLVHVRVAEAEMGQGVFTALPMLIAEELDVPLSSMRVEHATTDRVYGPQHTAGSSSVRDAWRPLREAGAAARAMLVAAAAKDWAVDPATCRTVNATVIHDSSRRKRSYAQLTKLAATMQLPAVVNLKSPAEFRLLGRPARRLDSQEKVNGTARYGTDIVLPDMVYASIAHPPVFRSSTSDFDAGAAKSVKGVLQVFPIDSGVAVVADNSWAALQGARAVRFPANPMRNDVTSESIGAGLRQAVRNAGTVARSVGNVDLASAAAAHTLEVEYELPFQAHATMEPMGCTAVFRNRRCEIWAPTQAPTNAEKVAMRYVLGAAKRVWDEASGKFTGHDAGDVTVHTTLLGGGFGRRLKQDYVAEVVQIAKRVGRPVRFTWSREEDVQHDFYRPVSLHLLRGGLDKKGMPLFWHHRTAGPDLDKSTSEYLPYSIPNLRSEIREVPTPVPTGPWRSVADSYHAFVTECFLDENAAAGKIDPVDLRIRLLGEAPRLRRVVERVATISKWGRRPPSNRAQGLAVYSCRDTCVAHVADVEISNDGQIRVPRVTCVIDCGMVVNPDTVIAQMESAVAFALSATLKGQITISGGRVKQSNFHDFPIIRMDEMPHVDVHIVPSKEPPGGVGEPGVPPLAPAVANAIYRATGKRIRTLPIKNIRDLTR
jgi:isoquinoline 1-oxidoreductase beta subunit